MVSCNLQKHMPLNKMCKSGKMLSPNSCHLTPTWLCCYNCYALYFKIGSIGVTKFYVLGNKILKPFPFCLPKAELNRAVLDKAANSHHPPG